MELNLNNINTGRNIINGRFLKGSIPHNKGKKAIDYLNIETINKNIENLKLHGKPNKELWKYNCKPVVCIHENKVYYFKHSVEAGKKLKICARNIRKVCTGERKKAGGLQFFWEKDFLIWSKLIK